MSTYRGIQRTKIERLWYLHWYLKTVNLEYTKVKYYFFFNFSDYRKKTFYFSEYRNISENTKIKYFFSNSRNTRGNVFHCFSEFDIYVEHWSEIFFFHFRDYGNIYENTKVEFFYFDLVTIKI